jgi:hypothetical protein
MVKVAIVGLVAAFLIFYIITSPDQAADIARGAGHLTSKVAHGIGNFVDKLAS